jgi:Na+-translocating ferredoxin:NAD+ oxidoreductase subunit B
LNNGSPKLSRLTDIMSNEIFISIAILTGMGLFFAGILAISYKKLKVYEDPRIDKVESMLPGANCGACGLPGCRAFAEKVVDKEINAGKCTVSSETGIEKIAGYLGIEASQEEKVVARLLCAGGKNEAHNRADYSGGLGTCRGESVVAGGPKECSWGCLGLGDCAGVCDFDAIHMNNNGLPVVTPEKCTACGDCVDICPKDLFVLMPVSNRLLVQCRSLLEGDNAEERCSVACTGCGKCAADCIPGVIGIKDNLAVIDYEKNELAGPEAIRRCPTHAIVWLEEETQFVSLTKKKKPLPTGRVEVLPNAEDIYYQ